MKNRHFESEGIAWNLQAKCEFHEFGMMRHSYKVFSVFVPNIFELTLLEIQGFLRFSNLEIEK